MIGYLSGKVLAVEEGSVIVDVAGVGYSVAVASKCLAGLQSGAPVAFFVHTNLRENSLELFGFTSLWEKKVFQLLTSVSGVGPRTALSVLGGLDAETVLSAVVREDRVSLTSVSGIGKKTAERLIIELGDKARKLLAERPRAAAGMAKPQAAVVTPVEGAVALGKKRGKAIPPQGASAADPDALLDIADLWNEVIAALANLGYREADALAVVKMASSRFTDAGQPVSLEKLIMSSLQLMSRGL